MARIKYKKVEFEYTSESMKARIVNESILKLAARDAIGITEDVVMPGELRKYGRIPDHIFPLGPLLNELSFRPAGNVSLNGKAHLVWVRMSGSKMTDEDAEEYMKEMVKEAKEKWRVERKPRTKVADKKYTNLEAALRKAAVQTRDEAKVTLTFGTSKEAYDFMLTLDELCGTIHAS